MTPAKPSLSDPHLLVVDDDERLRALLQRYLSTNGFRVSAAARCRRARALMKSMAFDCLILDVMMPGESGLDLAESVRGPSRAFPILMLTARGDAADRIAGLELGADDYLPKPFEPRELLLRINALLRRAAPVPETASRPVRMGEALYDPAASRLTRERQAGEADQRGSGAAAIVRRQCGASLSPAAIFARGWAWRWNAPSTCR